MNSQQPPNEATVQAFAEMGDDDFLDIASLWRAVLRYRWGVLGVAFSSVLATGLVVYAMQPVYQSTASLKLETANANVVGIEEVYDLTAAGMWRYEYVTTQMEILKSRKVAERVVRKLRLHEHPVYTPKESSSWWPSFNLKSLLPAGMQTPPKVLSPDEVEAARIAAITGAVMGGTTATEVRSSTLAYVTFESTSPALAAEVSNALVDEFITQDLENRLSGTTQATDWLEERLSVLRRELEISEQALQDFRVREGLVDIEGKTSLGSSELQLLNARLEEVRRARIAAENIRDEVQAMGNVDGASVDALMSIPSVLNHPLVRDVKLEQNEAMRTLAELAKQYGPKHPKIIAATQRLLSADKNLITEVRKVVSGIEREYDFAVRSEAQLQQDWEARRLEVQDFNRKEFELKGLQRDVNTNRELLDVFFTRLKGVNETGGFEKPHARMVDRAMVSAGPVKPNKPFSLSLALVLGTLGGCVIAILLARLDNAIRNPDDVAGQLGAPLLGTIPKLDATADEDIDAIATQSWNKTGSSFSEAMRTIRTGVVLSNLDQPAQVIVVTSSVPGEGKSTCATHLAEAFGQMERTVLVGTDLRRPSLARRLNLDTNIPGLSHFVSGNAPLDECVTELEAHSFSVIPSGVVPPNPLEMISSIKFLEALKSLRERFDRIILDSAPVSLVSDGLVLASYADSVIFVVKADSTSVTLAQRNLSNIVASNEPLTGVVLNMFDPAAASRYYYGRGGYRYGYGRYGYGRYGYSGYQYSNYSSTSSGDYSSHEAESPGSSS